MLYSYESNYVIFNLRFNVKVSVFNYVGIRKIVWHHLLFQIFNLDPSSTNIYLSAALLIY